MWLLVACVAAGPRIRKYSPLYRRFRVSATQARLLAGDNICDFQEVVPSKQHAEMSLFVKHVADKQHFPVFL